MVRLGGVGLCVMFIIIHMICVRLDWTMAFMKKKKKKAYLHFPPAYEKYEKRTMCMCTR